MISSPHWRSLGVLAIALAAGACAMTEPRATAANATPVPGPASAEEGGARTGPSSTASAAGSGASHKRNESGPLDPLAWLAGCWQGEVNQREFREMWLMPSGGVMLGAGQTVMDGKTTDYEHMRIEAGAAGSVVFAMTPRGAREIAYRLTGHGPEEFVFTREEREFPNRVVYHPGTEGWLYVSAGGLVNGADKTVTYPMRRIDCGTGERVAR